MAKKGTEGTVSAQGVAAAVVTVEVLHPITYMDSEYSRGLHRLPRDVTDFFLGLRVPNRLKGPQPVARLPVQAEQPKMGEVKPLSFEE